MIDFIEWSDDYCIGNNLLDIHHKIFFEMVRDLSKHLEGDKPRVDATEILEFLHDYIEMHFSAEEKLMSEIHFPNSLEHKAIHEEFSRNIQRLNKELYKEEVAHILDKILTLTQNWFLDHILTQDKQFSNYLH